MVDDNAENSIVVIAGANAMLYPDDVRSASVAIKEASVVVCQLETPVETSIEAFRIARESNVTTVLTPAPTAQLTDELLSLCDICIPNKTEIASIVGQSVETEEDAVCAVRLLRERGVKHVALTLGGEGVLLFDETGIVRLPATKVEAVDTTGAGDAFSGALAVGLADGFTLEESARRAAMVAAISVTRIGTQPSFCLLYTSPSPRDKRQSRMPSSA